MNVLGSNSESATTSHPRSARRIRPPAAPGLFGVRTWNKSRFVVAIILGAISVFPLLYMISLSFQPTSEIFSSHPVLIPAHPTVTNYVQAWTQNSFDRYFVNSAMVAIGTVCVTVSVSSLAAFAFARYRFPFKEIIFYIFLAALAVPSTLLIIPQYLLMLRLHLTDSLPGLILIYSARMFHFQSSYCEVSSSRFLRTARGVVSAGRCSNLASPYQTHCASFCTSIGRSCDVRV